MKPTNKFNLDFIIHGWLARNEYTGVNEHRTISVTSLLKSTKAIILNSRIPEEAKREDISNLIAPRMGTAIHSAIEDTWLNHHESTLKTMGYSDAQIAEVDINPEIVDLNRFQIFGEQRTSKLLDGWLVNGQYDWIVEGTVEDVKTTSTYTYLNKVNNEKYILQGSMYRWLNQDKVTNDFMKIHYVFTDWSKLEYLKNPNTYPQTRIITEPLKLLSVNNTVNWLTTKLSELRSLWELPQSDLPNCTEEELWRGKPKYKYYKNPEKLKRSTANFDNPNDAYLRLAEDGSVGIVIPVYGEPKACLYCSALSICEQGQSYLNSGELKF